MSPGPIALRRYDPDGNDSIWCLECARRIFPAATERLLRLGPEWWIPEDEEESRPYHEGPAGPPWEPSYGIVYLLNSMEDFEAIEGDYGADCADCAARIADKGRESR